jgi:N-acyl-D-amino-acid deacylase
MTPTDCDLVIAGGTLVDGTGAPGRLADVGIRGATIAAIVIDRAAHADARPGRVLRGA